MNIIIPRPFPESVKEAFRRHFAELPLYEEDEDELGPVRGKSIEHEGVTYRWTPRRGFSWSKDCKAWG